MPLDASGVSTLGLDSYSTLVDVEAAEQALANRVADPAPVSDRWRSRSLAYTMVANHVDAYEPFYEVAHVTALWFDVMGAEHAGMQGVRFDRQGMPPETFGPRPSLTVTGLAELADELGV